MTPRNATGGHRGGPDSLRRGSRIPLSQRIEHLVEQMRTCVDTGVPLNFSEPAHREITEALHTISYEQGTVSPKRVNQVLKVGYGDGSKGSPLHARCLSPAQQERVDEKGALHIGTLSFRHLDYDDKIDLYLIRDRETRALSNEEVDKLAYARMKELVQDPTLRRRESHLVIFQTGLEPLIVGMYRALVEELIYRRSENLPALVVQPVFFADDDGTGSGRIWA